MPQGKQSNSSKIRSILNTAWICFWVFLNT